MAKGVRFLLLGGWVVLGTACSLNPQPLPPDKPVDAGFDVNQFGSADASPDVDAETVPVPESDAAVDTGTEDATTDGGEPDDAGDGGDADSRTDFDADDGDGG